MLTPPIPEQIGRYRILSLLGSGAMGDVYLAVDPHIDRELAIKTVRVVGGTPADIADRKQRLLREAKAAGKMMHPHVVTLFDADETGGVLYLAFEYVRGMDLAHRVTAAPPLTLRQVLTLVQQVAAALDYAHGQRIVHRDIKPSNILIGPSGEAKVADFGIAKVLGLTEMTRTGSVVGSPQYMSPEQVRGEPLDGRSDVFSLGVVLYELLCRTRPFGGDTLSTLIFEILSKEPLAVAQLRPGLPQRLPVLVDRMLAKDLNARIPSARAVMEEIDDLMRTLDPGILDEPALGHLGTSARGSSASVSAVAPTATMGDAPTIASGSVAPASSGPVPPPLPPIPSAAPYPARTPQAAPPPMVGAPAGAAPTLTRELDRPSPLDTGTYAGAGRGKAAFWIALLLVVAMAGGFLVSRLLSGGGDGSPEAGEPVVTADASDAVPGSPAAGSDSASDTGTSDAGNGSADGSSPTTGLGLTLGAPAIGSPSGTGSPRTETDPQVAAPAQEPAEANPPNSPPTAQDAGGSPRVPPKAEPRSPASSSHEPSQADPAPTTRVPADTEVPADTKAPAPAEVSPTAERSDREQRRLRAFDAAAAQAAQELSTGTSFRFEVEPEDTIVKIQARGERSIVQGRVRDFEPGKDGRAMELPGSGDYLITLVHQSFPDLVVLVHADASVGNAHTVRLDMARFARRSSGGPQAIRVSRGIAFEGQPADAEVWVDGQRVGLASEWPGARLPRSRKNLQLDPGSHTVRLAAKGFKDLEFKVVVAPAAGRRIHRIEYQLRRDR